MIKVGINGFGRIGRMVFQGHAALIGGDRFLKPRFPGLHFPHDLFQFGQSLFKRQAFDGGKRGRGFCHDTSKKRGKSPKTSQDFI